MTQLAARAFSNVSGNCSWSDFVTTERTALADLMYSSKRAPSSSATAGARECAAGRRRSLFTDNAGVSELSGYDEIDVLVGLGGRQYASGIVAAEFTLDDSLPRHVRAFCDFQGRAEQAGLDFGAGLQCGFHVGLSFAKLLFEGFDLLPKHNDFGEPILCYGFNFRGRLRWEL
jgi:hypothetical protein